jgi:hypothetical protein
MKKLDEVKYPSSAELFKFCKEALNHKHNFEVKVIDQHVGAILGYDPADCSHWKKGKKNIKSLSTLQTIAQALEVDTRFVTDIAVGKMDSSEALKEYKGFGLFQISSKTIEDVRREFFRNPGRFGQTQNDPKALDGLLDPHRDLLAKMAWNCVQLAGAMSSPVFIPEIINQIPDLTLEKQEADEGLEKVELRWIEPGVSAVLSVPNGPEKPHWRMLEAREMGRFLLQKEGRISTEPQEMIDLKLNLFALHLLMPGPHFHQAHYLTTTSRDLVQQLSEIFWVSRNLVGQRMKDFVQYGN